MAIFWAIILFSFGMISYFLYNKTKTTLQK